MISQQNYTGKAFLAAMVLVTAATWIVGLMDIQFQTEDTLAFADGFPGDLDGWVPAGDPTNIVLSSSNVRIKRVSENQSYAMRTFPLPPQEQLIDRQLRARGSLNTITPASPVSDQNGAAFMLWFQNKDRETIQYLTVQSLAGDVPEYHAERIVSIPENARYFVTVLLNRSSDGSFELTNADVSLISTTRLYRLVSSTLFLAWIVLMLIAMFWIYRRGNLRFSGIVSVLILSISIGVLLPESLANQYVLPAFQALSAALSIEHNVLLQLLYKSGHLLFFLALALILLLYRHVHRIPASMIFMYLLVFAAATEGVQLHFFNRTTRLLDLVLDLAGVLLACLIVIAIDKQRERRSASIVTRSD